MGHSVSSASVEVLISIVLIIVVILLIIVVLFIVVEVTISVQIGNLDWLLWSWTAASLSSSWPSGLSWSGGSRWLIAKKIFGELNVKLDIFTFEVFARWHSELEFLINIKVDIVVITCDKIHPGGVWDTRCLFNRLLWPSCLFFLLCDLEKLIEGARHQIILCMFRVILSFLVVQLFLTISIERSIKVIVFVPNFLIIVQIQGLDWHRLHTGVSPVAMVLSLGGGMVEFWLLTTKIYTFFDLAFYALFILFPLLASSILLSLLFVEGTILLFLQSLLMLVLLFHHGFVGFLLTPILLFIFTAH